MHQESIKILEALRDEIHRLLPDFMGGFYGYGHLYWDDFNPHKSDLNCLIVSSKRPTPQQIKILESIHRLIHKKHQPFAIYATYLNWEDLGKSHEDIPPFSQFFLGRLWKKELHKFNDYIWWLIKNQSITLLGKETKNLNFDIKKEDLIKSVYEDFHDFWAKSIKKCQSIWSWNYWAFIYSDKFFEWSISGLASQYYILKNKEATSMKKSMEYCLKTCPQKFQNILTEAIRIRKSEEGTIYPSKWFRRKEGLDFLNYILKECNRPVENFYF